MAKYNQLFKQQVVNFYFEHHENLAFTLKYSNLELKGLSPIQYRKQSFK